MFRISALLLLLLFSSFSQASCPEGEPGWQRTTFSSYNRNPFLAVECAAGIGTSYYRYTGTEEELCGSAGWSNELGGCNPDQCTHGSMAPSCAVQCPSNEWHSGGQVGYGMSCPEPPGTPDDYGCVTSGSVHQCDPSGPNSGGRPSEPSSTTISESTASNSSSSDSGDSSDPGNSGDSDGSSGSGGSPAAGDSGLSQSEIDEGGENTRLTEWCAIAPLEPECQGWEEQTVIDPDAPDSDLSICEHGGLRDSVIGCDYIPSTTTICAPGETLNSNGDCIRLNEPVVYPTEPPPENLPPPPDFPDPAPDGSDPTPGDSISVTVDNQGVIDAINSLAEQEAQSGPCDPEQPNYFDCITGGASSMPQHTTSDAQSFSEAYSNFSDRLYASPLVVSLTNFRNLIPPGGGTCPTYSIDLSNTLLGTTLSTVVHCDIYDLLKPLIDPLMTIFWLIVSYRVFASA